MSTKRSQFAAAVLDSKLYVIGGDHGDGIAGLLNSVEVFDGASWAPAPSMPSKRRQIAAAVLGSKLYAIGGWGTPLAATTVETFGGTTLQ